jgi:hypothetical protein
MRHAHTFPLRGRLCSRLLLLQLRHGRRRARVPAHRAARAAAAPDGEQAAQAAAAGAAARPCACCARRLLQLLLELAVGQLQRLDLVRQRRGAALALGRLLCVVGVWSGGAWWTVRRRRTCAPATQQRPPAPPPPQHTHTRISTQQHSTHRVQLPGCCLERRAPQRDDVGGLGVQAVLQHALVAVVRLQLFLRVVACVCVCAVCVCVC